MVIKTNDPCTYDNSACVCFCKIRYDFRVVLTGFLNRKVNYVNLRLSLNLTTIDSAYFDKKNNFILSIIVKKIEMIKVRIAVSFDK